MPTAQAETTALDLTWVRSQFPSLSQTVNGQPAVFMDGPGGTQVPQRVIDAIADYLANSNANTCGAYATSRRTDAVIAEARSAMADFLGCDQDEVVFGPNMTTLDLRHQPLYRPRTRSWRRNPSDPSRSRRQRLTLACS